MIPTPAQIIAAVEAEFALDDLTATTRLHPHPFARSIAALIMRDVRGMSYPEIGAALKKQHSAIQYWLTCTTPSRKKIAQRIIDRLRKSEPSEQDRITKVLKANNITTAAQLVERLTGKAGT